MSRARFELRGWHVLVCLLTFFGAVIAVNVAFAVVAVRTFPGEDVRHSYVHGLEYNETLSARRAQAALGWRAVARLAHDGDGAALEVVLRTRDGRSINDATLNGELEWPSNAQLDRALIFESAGDGHYVARLDGLGNGRWRLRAHAAKADGALDFESELTW